METSSAQSLMSGFALTWARSLCKISIPPSLRSLAQQAYVSMRHHAGRIWRWSLTEMSTPAITGLSPSGLSATLRTAISQPLRLRKRCVLLIRRSKTWMMNAGAAPSCVCAGVDAQRTVSSRPILGLRTTTSARDTDVSILTLSPTSKRWPS